MEKAKKVLVIDDEPDTVTFLSTWLEDHGYHACSASDGSKGMLAILEESPDLVLMDLKMPNQTGIQLYRDIRCDANLADLPVIFITGMAELQIFDGECELLPEPAARLEKPVDLQALQLAINKVLG